MSAGNGSASHHRQSSADANKPVSNLQVYFDNEISVNDFWAYMPAHQYIFQVTGEIWPAASVNARVPWPLGIDSKPIAPAVWLDEHRSVDQMTWAPDEPQIIKNRLIDNGGWIERKHVNCYNLYRPPQVRGGDPEAAGPWLEHLRHVYPDSADHILRWLAHRVQRPGEKINHALVLGGAQGIGKDTILEPIKYAVGPWNFTEVSPAHLLGRFNGFVKSVILRISEARDLGDVDRYAFYDHLKVYAASPPDVLRCDEKNLREHAVLNVCGLIITSNHKMDGIYLPADDRRHYVAWSALSKEDFTEEYWKTIWTWYAGGGIAHVCAHLAAVDLSTFDPKAPPPKTVAFHDIVDANRAPEDAEIGDLLDVLKNPPAITLTDLLAVCVDENFRDWLKDRKSRRQIPHRLETAGYTPVRNDTKDGLWVVSGKRQVVYARKELPTRDRLAAASAICKGDGKWNQRSQ